MQVLQVPRLPRESSGRAAETKERESVHQTLCRRSKSHACHAKAAAEQRRPRSAKAYIRPPAAQQVPRLPRESSGRAAETKERQSVHQTPCSAASPTPATRKSVHQTPCSAASPTPATRKQRQSSGDQGVPKRTSDPLQCSKSHACHAKAAAEQRRPRSAKAYIRPPAAQQVPRLPRKSRGRAAETKERQSVHQTPCSAASPTPATRKQRQSSGDQGAPKRTSDPLQRHQVPRLPRKSSGRAAKPSDVKPCDDVKLSDIKHCDIMSSCVMSSCVMSSCVMSSCVMSTCVMSSCVMSSCVMSSCVMSSCAMSSCVMSTCVMSTCVMSSCVMSSSVMSSCVMSSSVMCVCVVVFAC